MFHERIPARQLSAWLFAGMTPVLIHLLSGGSWMCTAVGGIAGAALMWCVWRSRWRPTKWQCPILIFYIVILLGQLLHRTSESWPVGDNDPAVALIILFLGAWSASKGVSAAARTGTVLFWVVLVLYLIVFGTGTMEIRLEYLMPRWEITDALGFAVFGLPVASVCLLAQGEKAGTRSVLPALFATVASIITAGVLSPGIAAATPNAFYETCRSLNLLGVARRFEPLISAGMTVGWFVLISLFLSCCGALTHKLFPGRGRYGVWIAAVFAAVIKLCGLHIWPWLPVFLGALFWVGFPLLAQGLEREKKS